MSARIPHRRVRRVVSSPRASATLGAVVHTDHCSAEAIAAAVRAGRRTAEDSIAEALRHVERIDPTLRAFAEVTGAEALADARALDEALRAGAPAPRWAGVPIAVKGRAGLRSLQVRRLRAAGAIPIGVTSTPCGPGPQTWGHTDRGPTRNPWRPDLSPGGSSAGSAAAVAAGIVPVATGSDGAGSVRIPAAWCGIFGYKPTTGLLPLSDFARLTVAAPLARHPGDLLAWADIVLGPLLPSALGLVAAWSADLGFAASQLDAETVALARATAEQLVDLADLAWRDVPVVLADPTAAWMALREPSATAGARAHGLQLRASNDRALDALFAGIDLLFTPTTPAPAHGHEGPGEHMSVALTWAFNLSGHPALSVPAGHTSGGAPVGLQIITPRLADRRLLDLAERLPSAFVPPDRAWSGRRAEGPVPGEGLADADNQ